MTPDPAPSYQYARITRSPGSAGEPSRNPWNTGYRCQMPGCTYTTGFWPDDGSAEENIFRHLSYEHPKPAPGLKQLAEQAAYCAEVLNESAGGAS